MKGLREGDGCHFGMLSMEQGRSSVKGDDVKVSSPEFADGGAISNGKKMVFW